jgi:hypothetical protein
MRWWMMACVVCGCNEPTLSKSDSAPSVSIIAPGDGEQFSMDDLVELVGLARDDGPAEELVAVWAAETTLGEVAPDADGNAYLAVPGSELGLGEHAITLTALDAGGQSASTSVVITLVDGTTTGTATMTTPPEPGAPTVVLSGPTDGSTFLRDESITFVGTVADAEDAPDALLLSLTSTMDGTFWEGTATTSGSVSTPYAELSVGAHTLTLTAVDSDGHIATDAVNLEILNDGRPFATIINPLSGDLFDAGDTITFEGMLSDDEDDTELLTAVWTSDLVVDPLNETLPDSSGYTAFGGTLQAGTHLVRLTAIDTDGKEASDTVLVTIADPDLDMDGYTVGDGDCNDDEPLMNPGEAEVCDLLDNDCNTEINDPFRDVYEFDDLGAVSPNDTFDLQYYLGEIDADLGPFFSDDLELNGMTLHNDLDEDWYGWDADDEIWDNVDITVTVTVPPNGNYTIALYQVNDANWADWGAWTLEDSRTGNGVMAVSFRGELFSDNEDYFAIHVASNTWHEQACDLNYRILIAN